ncbi:hypothetical protein GIV63_28270, partial [Pseudomonas sp. PA-3-10C]|nr:hypothetical protein [Pseudomonas sp. PA-3-10C]
MKKFAFLQVWKQQIAKARKLVAGPTPEELPEKSFNMSTLIATRQKDGLMNIVTGNQTEELDLSFSPEKFVKIQSHTWDLISNAQPWKTPQEAFESD